VLRWSAYYAAEGLVRRVLTDTVARRNDEGRVVGRVVGQVLAREVYTRTDDQQ
jgi:hypothetical protein